MYDEGWLENAEPIKKVRILSIKQLQFHIWDEIGWQGVRALIEAALLVKYQHCDSIRLWRAKCEDEGIRLICKFLGAAKKVQVLELLDAEVSWLGCQMLGQILHSSNELEL